jgi:hypothetical protein
MSEITSASDKLVLARPVFVVLNDRTIALFENENVNALIKTVDIKKLDYPIIPKPWE